MIYIYKQLDDTDSFNDMLQIELFLEFSITNYT